MKKLTAFICMVLMILPLSACAGKNKPVINNEASSAAAVAESAGKVEKVEKNKTAPQAVSKVPSQKALNALNDDNYEVKKKKYNFSKDNMKYSATYPQLSGKISNLEQINQIMEKCALKTINSLGTGSKADKTTVKVNCDITYEGKNFISVGFNEYTKVSSKKDDEHSLRSVNINLKTGKPVLLKDLIIKNDEFYKELEKSAKDQLSPEFSKDVTAEVIKSGIDSEAVNFTKYGAVFSVNLTKPEKHHSSISLTFDQLKSLRTNNEIWNNFI